MKITWLGVNSMMLEAAGEKILLDPYPSQLGILHPAFPAMFSDADTVLLTHGHFDHLFYFPELEEPADVTIFCTKTPAGTLERMGMENQTVLIRPGQEFDLGNVRIRVLKGKHIRFDAALIFRTLFSPRMLRYMRNLPYLAWAFTHFPEGGETLVYEILAENRRIQILGSLNLDDDEAYEPGADLLVMPYQGNSRLDKCADRILERLQPQRVLLTHFDDAFPPLSDNVDLSGLKRLMRKKYPKIAMVRPAAGKPVHLAAQLERVRG